MTSTRPSLAVAYCTKILHIVSERERREREPVTERSERENMIAPLFAVGRADGHSVALAQPERQERGCKPLDLRVKLLVGPAHVLVANRESEAIAVLLNDRIKVLPNRTLQQRGLLWPTHMALIAHKHAGEWACRKVAESSGAGPGK